MFLPTSSSLPVSLNATEKNITGIFPDITTESPSYATAAFLTFILASLPAMSVSSAGSSAAGLDATLVAELALTGVASSSSSSSSSTAAVWTGALDGLLATSDFLVDLALSDFATDLSFFALSFFAGFTATVVV